MHIALTKKFWNYVTRRMAFSVENNMWTNKKNQVEKNIHILNGKRKKKKKISKNEPEDMMSIIKENSQECMFCIFRTLNLRMISHCMVCVWCMMNAIHVNVYVLKHTIRFEFYFICYSFLCFIFHHFSFHINCLDRVKKKYFFLFFLIFFAKENWI